ncbi:hypothetical protein ACLOJK_019111 [Asimina triloba]
MSKTINFLFFGKEMFNFVRWLKIDLRRETPTKSTTYDVKGESTLRRMRYKRVDAGEWVPLLELDTQYPTSQTNVKQIAQENAASTDKDDDGRQAIVGDGTNIYGDGIDGPMVALHGDVDSDVEPTPPSPFHYIENAGLSSSVLWFLKTDLELKISNKSLWNLGDLEET